MKEIANLSFLTCIQQSVMNFGILMVQGLVNSFGSVIMAAFAAAVKIDSFALSAGTGFRKCLFHLCSPELWSPKTRAGLCRIPLRGSHLSAFQPGSQRRGISVCPPSDAYFCRSLRNRYCGGRRGVSAGGRKLLLGHRHSLFAVRLLPGCEKAHDVHCSHCDLPGPAGCPGLHSVFRPFLGVTGIWMSVPIGWAAADLTGLLCYLRCRKTLLPEENSRSSGTVS